MAPNIFSITDLVDVESLIVVYIGSDRKKHEVRADIKSIGRHLITLFFQTGKSVSIGYPQNVTLKFLIDDVMYSAETELKEVKTSANTVFLAVQTPENFKQQQNRKYFRMPVNRNGVLVATDNKNFSTAFLTRTVNLSGGGVLLYDFETMSSGNIVTPEIDDKYIYTLVLLLETKIVLKLQAQYIRHEEVNGSHRYAFQFVNIKTKDLDTICKYVTNEQVKLLSYKQKF